MSVYKDLYDRDVNCCYIHGQAFNNTMPDNIILGFDDGYKNDSDVVPEFTCFEKYYQRIVRCTDTRYIWWLKQMDKESNNVYVYGHSLSHSDGDILRHFFETNDTRIIIYYFNEEDRNKKISNLALILGCEKLIELVGEIDPRIIIEPKYMVKKTMF